jgi:hypothetical protein
MLTEKSLFFHHSQFFYFYIILSLLEDAIVLDEKKIEDATVPDKKNSSRFGWNLHLLILSIFISPSALIGIKLPINIQLAFASFEARISETVLIMVREH